MTDIASATLAQWQHYSGSVNQRPARFSVDLGVAAIAPLARYPFVMQVKIGSERAATGGLEAAAHTGAPVRLQNQLLEALTAGDRGRFVGRCTTDNSCYIYFYVAHQRDSRARIAAVTTAWPERPCENTVAVEPTWKTYFSFLQPSLEFVRHFRNRKTCHALQESGDSLLTPRPISHRMCFATAEARTKYEYAGRKFGFQRIATSVLPNTRLPYHIVLMRSDTPEAAEIDGITAALTWLAVEFSGQYLSWTSPLIVESGFADSADIQRKFASR